MIPNSWTIKTQLRRAACFTLCLHCKLCTAVRTVLACVCVCSTAHVLLLTLVLFILFVFLLLIRQIQPRPQMGHRDPHVNFIMIGLQYRFRPATDLSHLKSGRHNWNICIFFYAKSNLTSCYLEFLHEICSCKIFDNCGYIYLM